MPQVFEGTEKSVKRSLTEIKTRQNAAAAYEAAAAFVVLFTAPVGAAAYSSFLERPVASATCRAASLGARPGPEDQHPFHGFLHCHGGLLPRRPARYHQHKLPLGSGVLPAVCRLAQSGSEWSPRGAWSAPGTMPPAGPEGEGCQVLNVESSLWGASWKIMVRVSFSREARCSRRAFFVDGEETPQR